MMKIIIFVALLAAFSGVALGQEGLCNGAELIALSFPNIPLSDLNPWLVDDENYLELEKKLINNGTECDPERDAGQVCSLLPAFGSGLTALEGSLIVGLTDRGPNQDCEDLCALDPEKYADACGKVGKGFPVPAFAPTVGVVFATDNGQLIPQAYTPLRGLSGNPMSGISPTDMDDTPYGPDCVGDPLPFDPNGIDPEDIQPIFGTNFFAVVEEYGPSIMLGMGDGTVFARYVPESKAEMFSEADTKIYGTIPDVFKNRRKNRGFESLVVALDSSYLIAIMQSPMGDRDVPEYNDNLVIRCVQFAIEFTGDTAEPIKLSLMKQFALEASSPSAYFAEDVVASDMKYSAGFALYDGTPGFVALERTAMQVKYFYFDFAEATDLGETEFADNLDLEFNTAGVMTLESVGVTPAKKTKYVDTDSKVPGGIQNWTSAFKQEGFFVADGLTMLTINDNDFGLENNGPTMITIVRPGRTPTGTTVCPRPEVPAPPEKKTAGSMKFEMKEQIVLSNVADEAKVEILAVDKKTKTVYTANASEGSIDAFVGEPLQLPATASYSAGEDTGVNSVDVCPENGYVAGAVEDKTGGPGSMVVLEPQMDENGVTTSFEEIIRFDLENCFLPDAIKWSYNCTYLAMACEGEGADVPGGVAIWDGRTGGVKVATFEAFDPVAPLLEEAGVRFFQSGVPSLSLEPEALAFTADSNYAFVVLQENNALAVVDLAEAMITEIKPLIYTPRSVEGYGIDASDEDGEINIRTYPNVFGMCQADSIVHFVIEGEEYFALACEGDAWDDVEEIRAADIATDLNRTLSPVLEPLVADNAILGRLEISYPMGYNVDTNTQEELYHFGARSFQIYKMDGTCVVDTGDWIEVLTAEEYPNIFNAQQPEGEDSFESEFDSRSDAKGPETESLAFAMIDGTPTLFVGNERVSTIMAFNITDPSSPVYLASYQGSPTNIPSDEMFAEGKQGILDPESLQFVDGLLYVGAPFSSTITTLVYGKDSGGGGDDGITCINNEKQCHCAEARFANCVKLMEGSENMCRVAECSGLSCMCPNLADADVLVPKDTPLCNKQPSNYFAATDEPNDAGAIPCVQVLGTGLTVEQ